MSFTTILSASRGAVFKPPATGAADSPFTDPTNHLDDTVWNESFGYYNVAHAEDTVWNHGAVGPAPGVITKWGASIAVLGGGTASVVAFGFESFQQQNVGSGVVANHNLGLIPRFKVYDELGAMLPVGRPIQQTTSNGMLGYRTVCFVATTTQIIMYEINYPGEYGLPAITKTYHVRCFAPVVAGGDTLIRPSRITMGELDTTQTALRLAKTGEAHSVKPAGRASDLGNGQVRFVCADGTIYDTNYVIGAPSAPYNRSFAGPPLVDVVV